MNAVEIEEAVSVLAEQPFDATAFPFSFLEAFGNKATTIKKLRSGSSNSSDIHGGVLQRNNIHIAVCRDGEVTKTLAALKASPATTKAKAKFVLASDGVHLEAEELASGETIACAYPDFPSHFGFFLPLAGITTVSQIRDNPIDIKATGRLNRLYVELLKENEDWGTDARRHDMNQFMARLIFCFFAEDTDIFSRAHLFTDSIERMSDSKSENTHEVIAELFRSMDTPIDERKGANLPRWADAFPWVNGGLFQGLKEVPRFSRIARSYLLHAGRLDWRQINPDIFGSMIQAVAEEEERGALGLHYTSVPNILKVLNPLFLDDLGEQLEKAGDHSRKLLNLRKRIARIRVFDPACGSGNFLVIAYIRMREIEAEIIRRRNDTDKRSWLRLKNYYGIEIKDFACEVARLSLLIAEFQCDVRLVGQKEAKELILPLKSTGQIHCGNALRMDWLTVCPPVRPMIEEHDLAGPTGRFAFGGADEPEVETYICGNPPYKGRNKQAADQKSDIANVFSCYKGSFATLDYVSGWIIQSARYCREQRATSGLVATNSICQGEQVALLWPLIFDLGQSIIFAHTSFKWSNLASDKAGVTVVIVGLSGTTRKKRKLYSEMGVREVDIVGPYLVSGSTIVVSKRNSPISDASAMYLGNMAKDGGNLIMPFANAMFLVDNSGVSHDLVRQFFGSEEIIHSKPRACLWITDEHLESARKNASIASILEKVRQFRLRSKAPSTQALASVPHRFVQLSAKNGSRAIVIPRVSSEHRPYLPVEYLQSQPIIGDKCYAIYDGPLWNMAIIVSRLHWVWIGTVCVRLEMRFSYSNTLGWNTFPVPTLTEQNKTDLTRSSEDILLAREHYFPATIAEMYDPNRLDIEFPLVREAHERNDEVLERNYIGRRFKNDSERLERLFDLYTKMTARRADQSGRVRKGAT